MCVIYGRKRYWQICGRSANV